MESGKVIKDAFDLIDEAIRKTYNVFPAVHEEQTDNVFDGGVTCAITSLSMLVQSEGMENNDERIPKHLEDTILKDIRLNLAKYQKIGFELGVRNGASLPTEQGLRTNFIFLQWYAKEKLQCDIVYAAYTKDKWLSKIENMKAPFVTSTSNALTSFGHIILVRGMFKRGDEMVIVANDPYGVYPYKVKKGGDGVGYPASMFPEKDSEGPKKYHTLSFTK